MNWTHSINERVFSLLFSPAKRLCLERETPSPLQYIGFDAWLGVISFLDGSSKVRLGQSNKALCSTLHNAYNWHDCVLDLSAIPLGCAVSLLKEYGSFITTLRLRGALSPCEMSHMVGVVAMCCPNLKYFDSFCSFSLVPWNANLLAFSVPFPSATSTYLTAGIHNKDHLFYSSGDTVIQTIPQGFKGNYALSIWQFEIENTVQMGYSVVMACCINGCPVGEFTLQDSSVADTYAINMLYPIPSFALRANPRSLTFSLRLNTSLPFGAGAVRVSSVGRVSLLKSDDAIRFINPSVPEFSD